MYKPEPADTSSIKMPDELLLLKEEIAKNVHEVWAEGRIKEGWRFGTVRNDDKKETPCLVPYEELPEEEKEYDRNTAMETIKLIIKLGYEIKKK
ncbi:MAG: Ryanodine receptor Ryr [Clostridia bacterium]|nr:Ryanodine receptor Ryr [Clostridia bacterium]